MHARDSLATSGISSVILASVDPYLRPICLARWSLKLSAANSRTVINVHILVRMRGQSVSQKQHKPIIDLVRDNVATEPRGSRNRVPKRDQNQWNGNALHIEVGRRPIGV